MAPLGNKPAHANFEKLAILLQVCPLFFFVFIVCTCTFVLLFEFYSHLCFTRYHDQDPAAVSVEYAEFDWTPNGHIMA